MRALLRVLGIICGTIAGGSLLALLVLDKVLRPIAGPSQALAIIALIGSYAFAGWASARLIAWGEPATGAQPAKSRGYVGIGIALAVLAALAGSVAYLEYRAAKSAKQFCDAVPAGTPMAKVVEAAQGPDVRRLHATPDRVTVYFVGLPPFSRHFCEVEGKGGAAIAARYFHLD